MLKQIKNLKGEYAMRCLKKSLSLIGFMLIGIILGIAVKSAVTELYYLLSSLMPSVFPSYSLSAERELFEALYAALDIISVALTALTMVYISLLRDNDRFEFIITKTEGLYKVPDVLRIYVYNFGISDIISCVVSGMIFTVPIHFIPSRFVHGASTVATLIAPYKTLTDLFGAVGAPTFLFSVLIVSHLISIPFALRFYRAKWLSGFAEGFI